MMRYFLGLALALLAIPGVSRADVIELVVTNTGFGSQGDTLSGSSRALTFNNTTSSSNALHSVAIRLFNTSVGSGGTNRTGTLNFNFSINGGSAIQRSASITLDAQRDYVFTGLSGLVATGGTNTLTISNASTSGDITLGDLRWTTLTSVTYSGIWSSEASVSPTQTSMGLYATVPEPTTMVLYGSAIAIGFGASVLRRFRKKSEELSAV
jgi:hypothetical protein